MTRETPKHKGDWLTNNPKTIRSWYPRRSVKMVEGKPKETGEYTVEELESKGMIGIYLDEDLAHEWEEYPLCGNPREWESRIKNNLRI